MVIPKLFLKPADIGIPIELKCFQFPVSAACADKNKWKRRGSTFELLRIWLRDSVFAHGQLYVALSRVRDSRRVVLERCERRPTISPKL